MYAKVEDLKKGDVVIISSNKGIFDVKLLRQPTLAKQGKKTTWGGKPRWTTIPCAYREDALTHHHTHYRTGVITPYTVKQRVMSNGNEFNMETRIDFTERECWIIKREN